MAGQSYSLHHSQKEAERKRRKLSEGKALSTKPDTLSSILRTHKGREPTPESYLLTSIFYTRIYAHK